MVLRRHKAVKSQVVPAKRFLRFLNNLCRREIVKNSEVMKAMLLNAAPYGSIFGREVVDLNFVFFL